MHAKTRGDIEKILSVLKETLQTGVHLRGLASLSGIHHSKVAYILEHYLGNFIEIQDVEQFGFRAKIIRLKAGKENTTLRDVLRYLELRSKIRSTS